MATSMTKLHLMVAVAALALPALAMAQNAPASAPVSSTDERRLTPEQVDAVLAESAAKRKAAEQRVAAATAGNDAAAAPASAPDPRARAEGDTGPPREVHGEFGMSVGTGGYREVYGTALYPLDDGIVGISLDYSDWGRRRWPR